MNASLTRLSLTPVLAVALFTMCNTALAQGTANGLVTQHQWDGGSDIFIGGVLDPLNPDPIKIDLDPNGLPWTKEIFPISTNLIPKPGQVFTLHETIVNAGTEAWTDWHEKILETTPGVITGVWSSGPSSVQVLINGVGLPFIVTGWGTPDLGLTTFPIQPGDILEIWKELIYNGPPPLDPSLPFLVIEEYPTPEPASAALIGTGLLLLSGRRRIGSPGASDYRDQTEGGCLRTNGAKDACHRRQVATRHQ